jgi:hypothetical protein
MFVRWVVVQEAEEPYRCRRKRAVAARLVLLGREKKVFFVGR